MKPVLILGAGPAGLMAAQACKLLGVPFSIVSQGVDFPAKSTIGGAQFVHASVPGVMGEEPDGFLTYHFVGSERGYRDKVYGTADVPFVSAANIHDGQTIGVWSIQRAYDRMWEDIAGNGSSINVATVTPQWLINELEADRWRRVVSTIPRHQLCLAHAGLVDGRPHAFTSQPVHIMNECMLNVQSDRSHVWYDGTPNVSWYRTSNIFGVGSTEWGDSIGDKKLPYKTRVVNKPISTDCQCFSGKVLFTGRFGAWRKGLLIHHAFKDTMLMLNPEIREARFDVV